MKKTKPHKLIHDAFPNQGTVQPAYQGSQSALPSPETMAPQMPSYDNSQMVASGEQ